MSTSNAFDPLMQSIGASPLPEVATTTPPVPPLAEGDAQAFDPRLVQQTKLQIRTLVNEIAQLSQSECSLAEFYDGFLNRVTSALASAGGAIWTVDENGQLDLNYQINLAHARLDEDEDAQYQHDLLLRKIAHGGESALVHPNSGSAEEDVAGNPTDFLLVLGVIKIDGRVEGIVEIFQRAGGGPATQRGYLRFLMQMCDLATDYLKTRRLRQFRQRQQLWDRLEQFIHVIHGSLDTKDTVYTIANEGRRLIDADRVSVALCRGRGCRVEVVSGLDSINRRARDVRQLSELTTAVVRGRHPLWYHGDADDLPPQIEKKLSQYIDQSHSRLVAIVPLLESPTKNGKPRASKPIGALVVEQLQDNRLTESFEKRVEVVAGHSADALSNALNYNSLFLLPLWKLLGKARLIVAGRNFPKALFVLVALVASIIAACVVPADLDLSATGKLQPALRTDIFARVDGTLEDLAVRPGQLVKHQQTLARLENKRLESEVITLQGSVLEKQQQIDAINRAIHEDPHMTGVEEVQLIGKMKQLQESQASARQQLDVYRQQQRQLIITSPVAGQVADWKVRTKLLYRPIDRGQRLMTVYDPAGDWELELRMLGRRIGKVDAAQRQFKEPLKVAFILATHPGQEFEGQVIEIDRTADTRDENGNTVRIRVAIDKDKLPDLRDGAKVSARVHCGRGSIGYVWFHELIETVQAKVLFWL